MTNDKRLAIFALVVALALAVAALVTAVVIVKSPSKAGCLYAAMAAYPDWQPGQPRVTETVPECEGLPEADKQEVRTIVADYTSAAFRNLQKGDS